MCLSFAFLHISCLFISLRVKNILCRSEVADELIFGSLELVPNFPMILHLVLRHLSVMEIYLIEPNKSQWFQNLNKGRISLSLQSLQMTLVTAVSCRGSRWTGKIRSKSKCKRGTCSLGDHLKSSTNSYTSSCNLCFQHVNVRTLVHMHACMHVHIEAKY